METHRSPRPGSPGLLVLLVAFACEETGELSTFTREELMDPQTCEECHPVQYRQWSGSMHAYASTDPYLRGLNSLGQEQTDGALGTLCVLCHAPMAVREGVTEDGLNLADLPDHLQGVTCYACHQVDEVTGHNNNQMTLADDEIMRGPIDDPVETDAHGQAYSVLHDGRAHESSSMCGSCHDVVTPNGLAVERAFIEWKDSLYADTDESGLPASYSLRCNSCHMRGEDGPIADAEGARPDRRRHDHSITGFGVVITDFPKEDTEAIQQEQLATMEEFRKGALCAAVCVREAEAAGTWEAEVWLHNESSGHHWPTGATQDRRVWAEVKAHVGDEVTLSSGEVAEGQPLIELEESDPNLWWFGDTLFDGDGNRVHALWFAEDYEPRNLPVPETLGGDPETWRSRVYALPGTEPPDLVTLRVKTRAMPLDLLDEMVAGGHLSQEHRDALPTFDMAPAALDWVEEDATQVEGVGMCVASSLSCTNLVPWGL